MDRLYPQRYPPDPDLVFKWRILETLLAVWIQFSIEKRNEQGEVIQRWHGGLSVLEDVELALLENELIDREGLPISQD